MPWSWSHTSQAYYNAKLNLADLGCAQLRVILCEWREYSHSSNDDERYDSFNVERYDQDLANLIASPFPRQVMIDSIWDRASDNAICDEGGFSAWMCPYGCHTVSFNRL